MYRYNITIKSKIKKYYLNMEYYEIKEYFVSEVEKSLAIKKAYALINDKKLKVIGEVEVELKKHFSQF